MRIRHLLLLLVSMPLLASTDGFYKDLFMDGGVGLTSRTSLPAAAGLGLSMEYLATEDGDLQRDIMITRSIDANGVLLYPDGAPRYRCVYTNGGGATNHGNSLGSSGRRRIRDFYYNGGSYTGSCAGAFIASLSYYETGTWEAYYHIWPGRTAQPSIANTTTGHFIMDSSALLDYYTFGGDQYVANVYHNFGPYPRESLDFPANTEILARFDNPGAEHHNQGSIWAYTEDEYSGRLVVIASHPEGVQSGERYALMKSILQYAMDGNAAPVVKGQLMNGETRVMDRSTNNFNPEYTKIGDRQFHHFQIDIPEDTGDLIIDLDADDDFEFALYLSKGEFAFSDSAQYGSEVGGADHSLYVLDPEPGAWYVGVTCRSTVTTQRQAWGYEYTAGTEVLNGVSYTITAAWNPTAVAAGIPASGFRLFPNYPNPFNAETRIRFELPTADRVTMEIFNAQGRAVETRDLGWLSEGRHELSWVAGELPSGMYYCRVSAGSKTELIQLLLLK